MVTYISLSIEVDGPEESVQRFHALNENIDILRDAAGGETWNRLQPLLDWAGNASASFPELMIILTSECDEYGWARIDQYGGDNPSETLEFSFEAQDWECPDCGELVVEGGYQRGGECSDCGYVDDPSDLCPPFFEAVEDWVDRRLPRLRAGWRACTLADAGLAGHPDLMYVGESMKIETDKGLKNIWLTLDHTAIQNVDCLSDCANLTSLDMEGCKSLQNVDGLANCAQLKSLDLRWCSALQNVDGLANCTLLKSLDLSGCCSIQNLDILANCTQLTSLNLDHCSSLQNVDGLSNCTQLTDLVLRECRALKNVDVLANCTQLTSLDLNECRALKNVDGLANCTQLTWLNLSGCICLQSVDGLAECTQLAWLDLSGCDEVNPIPRESSMSTREEVAAYQELLKEVTKE